MAHDKIADGRNITTAAREWDSSIDFSPYSNTYKLVDALLSEADEVDDLLDTVYHAHEIETASGAELEQFGKLVNVQRESGEEDNRYRARIKAEFAQSRTETTFDDFIEFAASVLGTDVENIEIDTPYSVNPARVRLFADPSIYENNFLTEDDIADIIGGGVPAGHEVDAREAGTFRLTDDATTTNDPNAGLTSDGIETGGTLAADLL